MNTVSLGSIVDKLGMLRAEIEKLTTQEKALRDTLAQSGYAEISGELFRATVSLSERATLDPAKVRAFLSPDQIAAATRVTEVTTVKVSAHKRAVA